MIIQNERGGWGWSKLVWNFSVNSSDLVAIGFPLQCNLQVEFGSNSCLTYVLVSVTFENGERSGRSLRISLFFSSALSLVSQIKITLCGRRFVLFSFDKGGARGPKRSSLRPKTKMMSRAIFCLTLALQRCMNHPNTHILCF